MTKASKLAASTRKSIRGATMVEYALMIVAIMLLAALAFRKLGGAAKTNAEDSKTEIEKRGEG